MDETDVSEPSDCAGCGAPLPRGRGQREVKCAFCAKLQEHPRPIDAGQEVLLVTERDDYELGTVVRSDGPDGISLTTRAGAKTAKVEDLVMVTRGPLQPGDQVYAKRKSRWDLTYVASVDGDRVVVKHSEDGFDDPFFDETVPAANIRLPVEESRRVRRTKKHPWLTRAKNDPFALIFTVISYAFGLAMVSVCLWLASLFVRAFLLSGT